MKHDLAGELSAADLVALNERADPVLADLWMLGDYQIKAWRKSGLLSPSIITGIIRTIKHDMIASKMGEPAAELRSVEDKLREILAL